MHAPQRKLSSDDQRALLACARKAITEAVVHHRIPSIIPSVGVLSERTGAFVTLYLRGQLRGCIGRAHSDLPLTETVVQCAIAAALHDPRFPSLTSEEVEDVEIEISVLSELQLISPSEVRIGEHGLLIAQGEFRGLLLPQVAQERHWSPAAFLAATCKKAGLGPQAWSDPRTQVFGFTVEQFSEADSRAGYSSST